MNLKSQFFYINKTEKSIYHMILSLFIKISKSVVESVTHLSEIWIQMDHYIYERIWWQCELKCKTCLSFIKVSKLIYHLIGRHNWWYRICIGKCTNVCRVWLKVGCLIW